MSCCVSAHCAATADQFGEQYAEETLRRYRRRGPDPTTRMLLDALRRQPLAGKTLLDVGGGIGILGQELARDGLARIDLWEASPASLRAARRLHEDSPGSASLTVHDGDFASAGGTLTADLVTLDRVICCYPDGRALLDRAAASCRQALALSFPRDTWYTRLGLALENGGRRLRGNEFRAFVHRPGAMAAVLRNAGFRRVSRRTSTVWTAECWMAGGIGGEESSRLDRVMPWWDFGELHSRRVAATPERVYEAIRQVRADEVFLFRTLTWLRRLGRPLPDTILQPGNQDPLLEVALRGGFIDLGEDQPRELVLGTAVIRPPGVATVTELFTPDPPPGLALAAMNFRVSSDPDDGGSLVTTETRVRCTDPVTRKRFGRYWRVVRPGSGFIRRMWLRAIARRAQASSIS